MELSEKIRILAEGAKYDVSCSSSGSNRKNKKSGLGNGSMSGICHSWSEDGRCISLLKILYTNSCIYDCAYCINRSSNDLPRATLTPKELADLTINFYRRNYIEGLFLSSGIIKSPDYTMEQLVKTMKLLREEKSFNGYIHVKAIPGSDKSLIIKAGHYADRLSVNIELPSGESLKLLAPQKNREAILKPMNFISSGIRQRQEEKKFFKKAPSFAPAGQSTQLIVGASPDSDLKILTLTESLYKTFKLKRVYYSAYTPVNQDPGLPIVLDPPMMREHRLYQADWLLRYYGFSAKELLNEKHDNLHMQLDPKCTWALRNDHLFPIEVNKADYNMLLRIPGIGPGSAKKIVKARKFASLNYDGLKKIGVVLKRAKYFITCQGKYFGAKDFDSEKIEGYLIDSFKTKRLVQPGGTQLSIFSKEIMPLRAPLSQIGGTSVD